jgi:predicted nucleic acid-binding protein
VKNIVVDASLIMRGLFSENTIAAQKLASLLSVHSLYNVFAPEFLKVELLNAIRFSTRDFEEAQKLICLAEKFPISYVSLDKLELHEAFRISWKYKTTVYDAIYHALALEHNATFITCDKKYYEAAHELGSIELVPA